MQGSGIRSTLILHRACNQTIPVDKGNPKLDAMTGSFKAAQRELLLKSFYSIIISRVQWWDKIEHIPEDSPHSGV